LNTQLIKKLEALLDTVSEKEKRKNKRLYHKTKQLIRVTQYLKTIVAQNKTNRYKKESV
jgi:hypothetical protein